MAIYRTSRLENVSGRIGLCLTQMAIRTKQNRWAVLAALFAAFGAAHAAPPSREAGLGGDPFATLVGKSADRRSASDAANLFITASGERNFLFRGGPTSGRIKYLCVDGDDRLECALGADGPAEEIVLLTAARGPRGDLFYKNDLGAPALRLAPHGGASVWWPDGADAVGALRSAPAPADALELDPATFAAAERRAAAASARLASRLGRPIRFDLARPSARASTYALQTGLRASSAPTLDIRETALSESDAGAIDARVLADAVLRVATGIAAVAADDTGARAVAARLSTARFVKGASPALAIDGATLIVTYDPEAGVAGRPSSAAVAHFLEGAL